MGKMKDEDLNVCEPAPPAPEAPTTSLLKDLKYSPSGEHWNSQLSRLSLWRLKAFRVRHTLNQKPVWNAQLSVNVGIVTHLVRK
jgi:hypothetical protein